ncbi:glycosyltransferase family 2 protein [Endozoicomonas numazuensis]|uniref:Uncharacterized protein n=1 Tax=Endozoicomonas numazuensis TaxID=1137799 RepID=A0A081N165_9GAMM|nr:glycosyltransferase family 2 protein [Endozoicomonas numazuensis]KEQ12188.1 hypothetical protein GZ78_27470 [Endozoicomonas numazuensis]
MNRDDDLKMTLSHNLNVLSKYDSRATLYANIFDSSSFLSDWVIDNYKSEIKLGILKVRKISPLLYWHFSWAKNSFKDCIDEDYYSSLDGDNFLSDEYVQLLISLIDNNEKVLFHGFSGTWGDGTSGQVTLPVELYKKYGYLDQIYPRQYDENGLIARALYGENDLVYASYDGVDIRKKSSAFKKACEFRENKNTHIQLEKISSENPLNPRGSGYVQKDNLLTYYQNFNESYTFLKCIDESESQEFHRKKMFNSLTMLNESNITSVIKNTFYTSKNINISSKLTVFSVIKNDKVFLNEWLTHYRSLGVERFIIVDDHSKDGLENNITDEDVFILKPTVGDFKNCKVYWLKLLMIAFQTVESWVLTIDSDEFLDLGNKYSNLNNYIEVLHKKNIKYSPSILLDMLPNEKFDSITFDGTNFRDLFCNIYIRPFGKDDSYFDHHSIKWGFGQYSEYSYRLDSRWRFFSTFDSLRKIPIFKYNKSISMNQGFHTLAYGDNFINADKIFSYPDLILPLKHYKFVSFFINKENKVKGYHQRTQKNLKRINSTKRDEFLKEIRLSPFIKPYSESTFRSVLFKPIGLYRIIGNDIGGLHSDEQTFENLKFILQNEPDFNDVEKIFILNRISDEKKLAKYRELLEIYQAKYIVIDFELNVYSSITFDESSAPSWFELNTDWKKLCYEISRRESKNKYSIHNNGARNFALNHGKKRYQWILPWDGNCFVNKQIMDEIKSTISRDDCKYIITPMQRLLDNNSSKIIDSYPDNADEEPQIAFRYDSKESFDENRIYGFQPKVELLKRLEVPGVWDNWDKIYPWLKSELCKREDAGSFSFSSSVYRLASGNKNTSECSTNRSHLRAKGIIDYLDSLA